MIVAIMQPYIFPYMGYFNLLHACDMFVSLDDVQHIRRGWINRNRLQQGGKDVAFTVPLAKSPRESAITAQRLAEDEYPRFLRRFEKTLASAYNSAPFFRPVRELVLEVLHQPETNMARLAERSLAAVLAYVGLERPFVAASALPDDARGEGIKGAERLIALASHLGATGYVNLPGGKSLYSPTIFAEAGLRLHFIEPALPEYVRPAPFIPGLSVIDALMYVPPEHMLQMFGGYRLS